MSIIIPKSSLSPTRQSGGNVLVKIKMMYIFISVSYGVHIA